MSPMSVNNWWQNFNFSWTIPVLDVLEQTVYMSVLVLNVMLLQLQNQNLSAYCISKTALMCVQLASSSQLTQAYRNENH